LSAADESLPAGRFEEDSTDPGTFNYDYDERPTLSEAELKWYIDMMRALELKDQQRQLAYVPVIYRGVKGIFVPKTSISQQHGALYQAADHRRKPLAPTPLSADEVESAVDRWYQLVLAEVKKALDDYDYVNRLAEEVKRRRRAI